MTLWFQANKLLEEYCDAWVAPIDKELWKDLKKRGDDLGKRCRVERMIVFRAFLEKAGELQRSMDHLSTLVYFNLQFQLFQICGYLLLFQSCIDKQIV